MIAPRPPARSELQRQLLRLYGDMPAALTAADLAERAGIPRSAVQDALYRSPLKLPLGQVLALAQVLSADGDWVERQYRAEAPGPPAASPEWPGGFTVTLPVSPGRALTLAGPMLTPAEWDQMLKVLEAMRVGLLREPPA